MAEGSFKLGFEGCLGIQWLDKNKGSPGIKSSVAISGRGRCQLAVLARSREGAGRKRGAG